MSWALFFSGLVGAWIIINIIVYICYWSYKEKRRVYKLYKKAIEFLPGL